MPDPDDIGRKVRARWWAAVILEADDPTSDVGLARSLRNRAEDMYGVNSVAELADPIEVLAESVIAVRETGATA